MCVIMKEESSKARADMALVWVIQLCVFRVRRLFKSDAGSVSLTFDVVSEQLTTCILIQIVYRL